MRDNSPIIVEHSVYDTHYVTISMNKEAVGRIIQALNNYADVYKPYCQDCDDCKGNQTVYGELTNVLDGLLKAKHDLDKAAK